MVVALFSVSLIFCVTIASATGRRLLSHEQELEIDSVPNCHCEMFAKVTSEFCTKENLESENWGETCYEVQNYINVGLGMFNVAAACHLELCHNQDLQFFQNLCEDLQSGRIDDACTLAKTTNGARRHLIVELDLSFPHDNPRDSACFDKDAQVVLKDGLKIPIEDVAAGSWIQTCQSGVFTPVLAKVDHQQDEVPMKELHFQDGSSLLLTPSHMVYSNDELIPAYAVQPGTLVDGQTVVLVANVTGHAMNVVTLRQDIVVNGMCATWLTEEFMPVAKLQFLWDLINHVAAFFPTVVFTSTQKISDFFVPLLDDGTIGLNTILAVMFSTGFLLVCISAAMVLSFYAVLHHFLGQWSHGSQIVVLN